MMNETEEVAFVIWTATPTKPARKIKELSRVSVRNMIG